jgi:hypothetical protein
MKIFFAATALALAVSTCTGLIMGWKYARRKSIALLTLAAGVLIPAILVFVERFPTRIIAEGDADDTIFILQPLGVCNS